MSNSFQFSTCLNYQISYFSKNNFIRKCALFSINLGMLICFMKCSYIHCMQQPFSFTLRRLVGLYFSRYDSWVAFIAPRLWLKTKCDRQWAGYCQQVLDQGEWHAMIYSTGKVTYPLIKVTASSYFIPASINAIATKTGAL